MLDDEFARISESAVFLGLHGATVPPVRRTELATADGSISALIWGEATPEIVFLHGGGQNAHTWDAVALLLGRPAVAIDLPGHGHSSWRADRDYRAATNANTIAPVIGDLAPGASMIVGMSLGGLTAIQLAAGWPELAPKTAIIDVAPQVPGVRRHLTPERRGAVALLDGQRTFSTFEAMVQAAAAAVPHRPASILRRGVAHNAVQNVDGTWQWRYDTLDRERFEDASTAEGLWNDLAHSASAIMLVLGAESSFVTGEQVRLFAEARPDARIETIPGAGHSVQSDQPEALATVLAGFLAAA